MRVTDNAGPRSQGERRGDGVKWPRWLLAGAVIAVSMTVVACGGSGSTSVSKGPLTIAEFGAFEGDEAATGPALEAECAAALGEINSAGGVLGHKVQCVPYDSSSDPADAVPIANRMLATAKNLILVTGPGSQEPAVEPLLNNAKVIHFANNGLPFYDHQSSPYFFRPFPSDSLAGVAEAIYLTKRGYTHAAAVFDTSSGAQVQVPSLVKTYTKLGGRLAINLKLAPGNTYRTEAARLLAAKPDAIITELDSPQELSAWYSALGQLSQGKLPPIITTSAGVFALPDWAGTVQRALGAATPSLEQVNPGEPSHGPGYDAFKNALLTSPAKIPDRTQYLDQLLVEQPFDAIIVDALAIDEAKSTDPAKVGPLIEQIANGVPGATTVNTYAQGAKAIAAGDRVHYVGAGGPLVFDKYHNVAAPFEILTYKDAEAGWVTLPGQTITISEITRSAS